MPYKLSGNCVVKSDTGENVKCHETHEQALAHLRALYANVPDAKVESMVPSPYNSSGPNSLLGVLGLGRSKRKPKVATKESDGYLVTEGDGTTHLPTHKNGKPDRGLAGAAYAALTSNYRGHAYTGPNKDAALSKLRSLYKAQGWTLPDSIATKELDSSAFRIYKHDDGTHRWVLTSSSGFEDGDGETIRTKTLSDDSERMTREGNYGPLRYWHIGSKSADPITKHPGLGVDIGVCDLSTMHSHTRIESGTFYDEKVAASLIPHTKEIGGSLGFFYPATSGKVIDTIYTFERSILPKMHASNLMSRLKHLFTQEDSMDAQLTRLKELVGDEGVATILADVEAREAQLKIDGVKTKAKLVPPPGKPKVNPTGAKTEDESGEDAAEEKKETSAEEAKEDADEADAPMKKKTKELVDQISDAIAVKMSDKFVTPAMLDAKFSEVNATKTKESDALATALKSISDRLSTLEGETPESKKGFKASESGDTLANSALTMQLLTQMAHEQGLDLSALGVKGGAPTNDFERVSTRLGNAMTGAKA